MPKLPSSVTAYKRTPEFNENTVPEGLLRDHRTRPGVWARIVVLEGLLMYETFEPAGVWVLRPGVDGLISPGALHRVSPCGHVRFFVEFLR